MLKIISEIRQLKGWLTGAFITSMLACCLMLSFLGQNRNELWKVGPGNNSRVVNLQPSLDKITQQEKNKNMAVVLFDLKNQATMAEYNTSHKQKNAELVDLAYLVDGYNKFSSKFLNADDKMDNMEKTREDCLKLMFVVADNECKTAVKSSVNDAILLATIKENYGMIDSDLENFTVRDVTQLMKYIQKTNFNGGYKEKMFGVMKEAVDVANFRAYGGLDVNNGIFKNEKKPVIMGRVGKNYAVLRLDFEKVGQVLSVVVFGNHEQIRAVLQMIAEAIR